MPKQIEFFFDYGSPASYLAWTQLPAICAVHGADLIYRPMLLGGVFKSTGNQPPATVKAKGAWMNDDLARFANRFGVPFRLNRHFPVNTLPIMRGAYWAESEAVLEPYNDAMFRAMWADDVNLSDSAEIDRVLANAKLDGAALAAAIKLDEVKSRLIATTEEAIGRGVFGAPSIFVGGEMHFGQDRLDWVVEALARAA